MYFKDRLKSLRLEKKFSQIELSKKLNISNVTLSQYENGIRKPDLDTLTNLSNYFNVTTDYLLGKSDIKNPYTENKTESEKVNTIAAHLDSKDFSDEDLDDINKFIEFVKTKNNK